MDKEIKQAFIRGILSKGGKRTVSEQKKAIAKFTDRKSGIMVETPTWKLLKNQLSEGSLQFSVATRQRFQDAGLGRKASAESDRKPKRRKKKPVYNKIVFSNYNDIIYKLMYYYTDEVKNSIRKNLERNIKM